MNTTTLPLPSTGGPATQPGARQPAPGANASVGLWVFVGVGTTLFFLFLVAFIMRMSERDATAIAMPWQLWLSTAWLAAGSVLMKRASHKAVAAEQARQLFALAGACALAFIAVQGWAWVEMFGWRVTLNGGPAGSFFFLLTAVHGLHVAGGLIAWGLAQRARSGATGAIDAAWRRALCARYWHFLLAVWLALFAALSLITPEVAAFICGTR